MAYRLDDRFYHLAGGDRHGFGDERLARALAVPVAYLGVVRRAAGLVDPGKSNNCRTTLVCCLSSFDRLN
jgi:hypothetical protein